MTNITVGADPELFLRKGRHWVSAHTYETGTKYQPRKTEFGYVQVDGIALEFNIPPARDREEFVKSIRSAVRDLGTLVHSVDSSTQVVCRPSIFFGHKRLSQLPEENALLGCEPDYDAWTMRRNPPPQHTLPIRTGAGHIHVGWCENANPRSVEYMRQCAAIVRQMDYYLGLMSLIWDTDARRRLLYGKAGAFRPKPYGLEYRVLSNAWVIGDEDFLRWVYDLTIKAVSTAETAPLEKEFGDLARKIINNGEVMWSDKYPNLVEAVLS